MAEFDREASVFMANLAMKAKCYDVMVKEMTKVANKVEEMTEEERKLVAEAYKKAIGPRMDSWRIVSDIEQGEESRANVTIANWYKEKMEGELIGLCKHFLRIIYKHLIPSSRHTPQTSVLNHTMEGDYYRYLAELKNDDIADVAVKSREAYEKALDKAQRELHPDDPIRLGVSVKLSVLYSRLEQDYEHACNIAQQAINKANLALLHNMYSEDEKYEGTTRMLDVLQHNIQLWKAKIP